MRGKLPQPNKLSQPSQSQQFILPQKSQLVQPLSRKLQPSSFSKDRLYLTYTGIISSAFVNDQDSLSLTFIIQADPHWKIINGNHTGISQVASIFSSKSKRMVWNMPFEITYETTVLSGWPQIVFILTGSDFFGRSVIRAYGNMHLPCSVGKQKREVQLFKPLPQSLITEICGYLNGTIAEYKEPEKVLTSGDGREVTRVETMGRLEMEVETSRYNFGMYNYS